MDSYALVKLPYCAPDAPTLPTYEEIDGLRKKLSDSGYTLASRPGRRIVQFRKELFIKYGKDVDLTEGQNMLIVNKHTHLPIPKLYSMYVHEPTGDKVIIMEYIKGRPLNTCYASFDDEKMASIGVQLRQQLSELRAMPSPGYYGSVGRQPYLPYSWILKEQAGPFESADEFLNAYFKAQFSEGSPETLAQVEEMKSQFLELSKNHNASVFTHGDLQSQNIMLREDGTISIIDWESASFCPQYFEYFINAIYPMASAGWSEEEKERVFEYDPMVKLITKVWYEYLDYPGF
ncbi:kinase-like domain-containing protein [Hypoxylon fragiforme]|uniref:kinase-like domain-containing protein n=1 Tax=Hypoxylon fragiforme TaxID=63214 RepID=UPI0020C70B21|nr:kinase-like domain-containing protein [Hypoxylon fragiforme]KAI2603216.1 kinase-like domain-containing protein [Hypoxylon fragiforme]